MLATDCVERLDERDGVEPLAVDRDWRAPLETDHDSLWKIGSFEWSRRELQQIVRWGSVRILQDASLVRQMPQIGVARIDLLFGSGDRNSPLSGICDRVLAAPDVPFAPGRDHRQIRRERGVRELESHLIVSLSRAAVRERVGSNAACDLDLTTGDERPSHRCPEEVLAIVHGSSAQRGEDEVANEFLTQVLHEALFGARGNRLGADPGQLALSLTDIRGYTY